MTLPPCAIFSLPCVMRGPTPFVGAFHLTIQRHGIEPKEAGLINQLINGLLTNH